MRCFFKSFLAGPYRVRAGGVGRRVSNGKRRVWSRRADVEDAQPNVERLAARATAIVDIARTQCADGKRGNEEELATLRGHRALRALRSVSTAVAGGIKACALDGGPPAKVAFWPEFKRGFDHYLSISELRLPSNYDPRTSSQDFSKFAARSITFSITSSASRYPPHDCGRPSGNRSSRTTCAATAVRCTSA